MKLIDADALLKDLKDVCERCGIVRRGCCYECLIDAIKYTDEYKQLQKPLTLEETKKQVSVWIEYSEKVKYVKRTEPALYVCSNDSESCFDEGFSEQFRLAHKDYGEMWRCWATKPTDEECTAAKWEE